MIQARCVQKPSGQLSDWLAEFVFKVHVACVID